MIKIIIAIIIIVILLIVIIGCFYKKAYQKGSGVTNIDVEKVHFKALFKLNGAENELTRILISICGFPPNFRVKDAGVVDMHVDKEAIGEGQTLNKLWRTEYIVFDPEKQIPYGKQLFNKYNITYYNAVLDESEAENKLAYAPMSTNQNLRHYVDVYHSVGMFKNCYLKTGEGEYLDIILGINKRALNQRDPGYIGKGFYTSTFDIANLYYKTYMVKFRLNYNTYDLGLPYKMKDDDNYKDFMIRITNNYDPKTISNPTKATKRIYRIVYSSVYEAFKIILQKLEPEIENMYAEIKRGTKIRSLLDYLKSNPQASIKNIDGIFVDGEGKPVLNGDKLSGFIALLFYHDFSQKQFIGNSFTQTYIDEILNKFYQAVTDNAKTVINRFSSDFEVINNGEYLLNFIRSNAMYILCEYTYNLFSDNAYALYYYMTYCADMFNTYNNPMLLYDHHLISEIINDHTKSKIRVGYRFFNDQLIFYEINLENYGNLVPMSIYFKQYDI